MEIKQLRTFQAASKNLNFTQTSKELNYAQSSVTAQIKALELELGTTLFERLGKRLLLTEAGRQFKSYADNIILLSEEAKFSLNAREQAGSLVIGAQESQCTYRLPPLLKKFKQKYPLVKLIFKPAHSDERAREQLLQGQLDLAFIMDTEKPEQFLHIEPLIEEELKLVASSSNPLGNKSRVLPEHIKNETLLLTETGCSYRTLFERCLHGEGVYPANIFEFGSIEAIKQCVIADLGIALLPEMTMLSELKEGKVKELNWGTDMAQIQTKMAWHKDKWITPPLEAFIKLTRGVFNYSPDGEWS
ncbi:LysR family transcriptional regulator [Halobacillus shinanisalinarum]|uniref:LysR family transcriptional regulator n=1 Tax=Halobacillus shinanisalinarum TaxID=2932258 RepID=A0ABY4GUG1_9BACI|nr:LysR family transcriptional regulator [Halobacillus shinanisalinarum]UOQ91581.1 LysR family transcriptional regulator [Halobacillus shinanisalinarum]